MVPTSASTFSRYDSRTTASLTEVACPLAVCSETLTVYNLRPPPQRPVFLNPNPAPGETDIAKLADAGFMARWSADQLPVFQTVLSEATKRSTMGTGSLCSPSIHVVNLLEKNEGEDQDVTGVSEGAEVSPWRGCGGRSGGARERWFCIP